MKTKQTILAFIILLMHMTICYSDEASSQEQRKFFLLKSAQELLLNNGYEIINAISMPLPITPEFINSNLINLDPFLYSDTELNEIGEYERPLKVLVFCDTQKVFESHIKICVIDNYTDLFVEGLAYAKFDVMRNIESIITSDGKEVNLSYSKTYTLTEYLLCFPNCSLSYRNKLKKHIIEMLCM